MHRRRQTETSIATSVETSRLADAELYRHCHRTAPIEDLRFFLRIGRLSADVRAAGERLLAAGRRDTGGSLTRADWYRQLTALQDRWRQATVDGRPIEISEPMAEAV